MDEIGLRVAKPKALTAPAIAYIMGFTVPIKTPDGKDICYGRKALVGQYTKPYVRAVLLEGTRISNGRRKRYEHDNGTEGRLDYSGVINAASQSKRETK